MNIGNIEIGKNTVVIIGKNGSGKTQLLQKIYDQHKANSIFVPSARGIHTLKAELNSLQSLRAGSDSQIQNRGFVQQFDVFHISSLLAKDYLEMAERRRLKQIAEKDYIQVLNRLLKKISPEFSGVKIEDFSLMNAGGYPLNRASDGEKHTIVVICAILAAPYDSICLIDEPEIGLHTGAVIDLFNELEKERKDCTFIYATHSLPFAKTRENAKVFYLSQSEPALIKEDDEFEKDLLIDINGISKPILLVEGKDTDRKLYTKIFRDYEVRNGDGCGQIMTRVKAVREFFKRQDVFGLLDGDDRSKNEIEELKIEGCFCIPYAQHEHLYILPEILDMHLKSLNKTELSSNAILIDVIKNASDFSNHDLLAEQEIKTLSETITSDKILDFLKRYRGKDLVGKVATKLESSKNNLLNMAFKEKVVEKIKLHLVVQKMELLMPRN